MFLWVLFCLILGFVCLFNLGISASNPTSSSFMTNCPAGYVVFCCHFHLIKNFIISFQISLMIHSSSDNVLFGVHVFVYFLQFLLLLVFTFISLSIYILEEIISPKKLVGLALYHITWSILEFLGPLRRVCIMQYLWEIIYRCLLSPFEL